MTGRPMGSLTELLGGRYRLLRDLGRGSFGQTYLAEDTNRFNELCVLKEFLPQVKDPAFLLKAKQLFEREAGVLAQLNHPQIPRFRELLRVQMPEGGRLFLVQDYVEGPTFQDLLETRLRSGNTFSEAEVIQLLMQILPVLDYLHGVGVIHRDIAPDNLILRNADGLPVLIDFGGVKRVATLVQQQIGPPVNPTRLGKEGYAPEEQMELGQVTPSADLYALAVTALVLLTGEAPQNLYDAHHQTWHWQERVTLNPRFEAVLRQMLATRPGDRYSSAAAVMEVLQTPQPYSTPSPSPTLAVAPGRGYDATILPVAGGPPVRKKRGPTHGCWSALLGLLLLLGAVGLVWWVAGRWDPTGGSLTPNADNSAGNSSQENAAFSSAEQARKAALQQRRENLGVEGSILVGITDQIFYDRYPQMQGQALSDRAEDADLRAQWDGIAGEVLDILERDLSAAARASLGQYSGGDLDRWTQSLLERNVGRAALVDLSRAKFADLFPNWAGGEVLEQPIGQIWYGLADDRFRALQSGDRLEEIRFAEGTYRQSVRDRLEPGSGRVYLLNLREGQFMRLNLQAPAGATRLSLYLPSPTAEQPYLLTAAPETSWSGQLTQSGYYEIVVVSAGSNAFDYALDVAVDNVSASPTPPPEEEEN